MLRRSRICFCLIDKALHIGRIIYVVDGAIDCIFITLMEDLMNQFYEVAEMPFKPQAKGGL
ncbi:hypothetical protein LIS77_04065 [Cytobacillus firmus]|uniref:hypothetical protein n=1 Tax=Bacillaceae TaxID=186817 RepID=UPI00207956D3|nr:MULTISPECIES: hypothetical protein [Bacillaceae]USK39712.1 hypothetical protein LIS77_04065 [Cytobacillus firmus]